MTRQPPIIFCPEMVKAAYESRKTMTRRIEGLKVLNAHPERWRFTGWVEGKAVFENSTGYPVAIKPRYRVGDECWIKEVWATNKQYDNLPPRQIPPCAEIWFPDELGWEHDKHNRGKVRTSRFMCKWMARRWLRITKVNDPERVNAISINDICAEGVCDTRTPQNEIVETYHEKFAQLWDSLHKKPDERFEHGPWAFSYEFEMIEGKPK